MQFHLTGFDPAPRSMLVCRYQRYGLLIVLAMFWGAGVAWQLLDGPPLVVYGCYALAALLTLPILRTWRQRGRADNWSLALDSSGVWLNLRPVEYHAAERGETIVHLPYAELQSARRDERRYTLPNADDDEKKCHDVYLELQLASPTASVIQERIAAEQRRQLPPRRVLGGLVTTRQRRTVATIQTVDDHRVCILHSSATHRLSPSLKKILAALAQFIPIETEEPATPRSWDAMTVAETDDLILSLASQGRIIDAMHLARSSKDLTLGEARELVDSLR